MEKFEFDYYDWAEFEQFLDQLPDKDAAKLIATIQNIENNGLLVAERQLWVKKLVREINTLLLMRSRKKRKRHLKIKRKLLGIDAVSI